MRCSVRLTLSMLAAAIVPAVSATAPAQPDAVKAEANRKLGEARKLFEAGDFDGALRKLKLAYDLVPSPKIHFSFGQAHRGLGRYVEALDSFNRFLSEAKDADPALRREAEQYMKDLTERVSFVEIVCDVAGADVAIDGRSYGPTPMPGPIVVTPGPHQIVIQRPGDRNAFVEKIEPHRAAVIRLNARLAQQPMQEPAPPPPPTPVPAIAPAPPAATAVSSTPPPAPTPTHEGWLMGRRWTWIAAGGAAVFATGGAIAGLSMQQRYGELSDRCGVSSPSRPGCRESEIDSVATRQHIANWFWVLTGAAAAAAGILFVVEGRGVTVAPAATTSTVGVIGRATF